MVDVFPKFQKYPGDPAIPYPIIELLLPSEPSTDAYVQTFGRTEISACPGDWQDYPPALLPGISKDMPFIPSEGQVTFYVPSLLFDRNWRYVDVMGKTFDVSQIPTLVSPFWFASSSIYDEIARGKYDVRPIKRCLPPTVIKTSKPNLVYNPNYKFLDNILDDQFTSASGTIPRDTCTLIHFNFDFGSVITIKSISILFHTYNSDTDTYQYLDYSQDGSSWTSLKSWHSRWPRDNGCFYYTRVDGSWNMRYLRLRTYSSAAGGTTQTMYLYHLTVFQ